jgi:hypothetical protein
MLYLVTHKSSRTIKLSKEQGETQYYLERYPGNAEKVASRKVENEIRKRGKQMSRNLDGGILNYILIEIDAKSFMKSAVL